jgi:cell wall-associated NlpC family hydrolase
MNITLVTIEKPPPLSAAYKIVKINSTTIFFLLLALLSLVSGCATTPEIKANTPPTPISPTINLALSLQGTPYRYGKASPEEGFDCSSFVKYVYQKQGINLPRTVKEMASYLPQIPKDDIISGDLVFFNTDEKSLSHVGIYINSDKFIHAPSQKTGKVLVSSLNNQYWHKHYIAARRPSMP